MSIICIDAGHTPGVDPGACGNGLKEADITGDICDRVVRRLTSYVCDVRIVPRTDDLSSRCTFANNLKADLFVSIHCNAGGGEGFESYIHPDAGDGTKAYRAISHNSIMEYLKTQDVIDRGKKTANYQVLRDTNMPAILFECLFVDNKYDAAKLQDPVFIDALSNEITWGIAHVLGLRRKPENPCAECNTVRELMLENAKLRDEHMRLKQSVAQVKIILGGI